MGRLVIKQPVTKPRNSSRKKRLKPHRRFHRFVTRLSLAFGDVSRVPTARGPPTDMAAQRCTCLLSVARPRPRPSRPAVRAAERRKVRRGRERASRGQRVRAREGGSAEPGSLRPLQGAGTRTAADDLMPAPSWQNL
eukprot:scaffold439_cov415-Prasinococcus_capsulatus_cf.AAC.36